MHYYETHGIKLRNVIDYFVLVLVWMDQMIAEVIGTFFVIFAGCGSVVVNKIYEQVTFPGVCVTWGLIVMVMVYSVGHISGAHFNPAVTITFAVFRRFPYREVPAYIVAQLIGSIMASGALALLFDVTPKAYFGTVPVGSDGQSFVLEIFISFLLMFVISGVSTDSRAVINIGLIRTASFEFLPFTYFLPNIFFVFFEYIDR